MNLLKIIFIIFLIYFIRRFVQMYRALRILQLEKELSKEVPIKKSEAVDADFEVID